MYNKGKYVVGKIRTETGPIEAAIIFPETINHAFIGRRLFIADSIVGAGFFHVDEDASGQPTASAYGQSGSLGIKSRNDDDVLHLNRALGLAAG